MTPGNQSLDQEQRLTPPTCGRGRWLLALLLFLAVVIAYLPALRGEFLWDDDSYISNNPTLHSWQGLRDIWLSPGVTCQYYPLSFTLWWVCWHLWGLAPIGYHIVTLLLHICAALLLWQVLDRLKVRGAWLAGAIFALHPVNVMSVAWMTELKNTLSSSIALCSIWAYIRFARLGVYAGAADNSAPPPGRAWRWYGLSLALFILAMLAKTAVSFVPVSLLLIVWWQQRRLRWRDVWPVLPMVVLVKVFGAVTVHVEQITGAVGPKFNMSIIERILVSGRSFWFYLGKLLWPYPLTFIYERWKVDPHAACQYLFPLATVALFAALWWWRHRIGRAVFAAFLHFYVCTSMLILGVVLYFTQFSFVSDHWQYFGCMSLFALAAAGITSATDALGKYHRYLKPALSILLLVTLTALTWRQCGIYRDCETLWSATIANNPSCWIARDNLGQAFLQRGRLAEAIACFRHALTIKPDYDKAHSNLGVALQQEGRLDEALVHYDKAIEINPNFAEAHYNLALAFQQEGRLDKAIAQCQKEIDLKPDLAEARFNIALALQRSGRTAEAITQYQKALEIKPDDAKGHYYLATALQQEGRLDEAVTRFRKVIELKPAYAEAENDLGNALRQNGRLEEAMAHYQKALQINPDYAEAHNDLAVALQQMGRLDEAIMHYQKAIDIKPDFPKAYINLAGLSATCRNPDLRDGVKAEQLAQRAIQLTGGNDPTVLGILAAAYGAQGAFSDAKKTVQQALDIAQAQGNTALISLLQQHLKLYESGQPVLDKR